MDDLTQKNLSIMRKQVLLNIPGDLYIDFKSKIGPDKSLSKGIIDIMRNHVDSK